MVDGDRLLLETWRKSSATVGEWDALAERNGNPFGSPEWNLTWWKHWGAGRALRISACRRAQAGTLVAIYPLYLATRRPLRVLRFLGHGPGDMLGPVCAPADRAAAGEGFRRALTELGGNWDLLLGQQVPAADGVAVALGAHVLRRERSPVLPIVWAAWDDYLASRSANFRQQLRRRERRLARSRAVRFRLTVDQTELHRDLTTLFSLHTARWGTRASSALAPSRQPFHREFAARALARGRLRLWILEVEGDPVAAWYGFRLGGIESYYQAGWDPRWADASVGTILLAHSIRSAFEDGMREYRFLRGGEEYKGRFTDSDAELETFALGNGLLGNAAVVLARRSATRGWSRGPLGSVRRLIGLRG